MSHPSSPLIAGAVLDSVTEIFQLLGDGTRVRILDALSRGERCVSDLSADIGMSESATSHQLRLLRTARLVRVRRDGRQAYYALDDEHVMGLLRDARRHAEEAR